MTVLEPEKVNNRLLDEPGIDDDGDEDDVVADGYDKDTVLFGDGRTG